MTSLARKLHATDYFTLAFGTMVGVGWLVVMDDWLRRGGPLGAILGFVLGGAALLPIGYVYGRLVMEMPDAGSEIAYTERVFPREISYWTGWIMTVAYWVVCPWEAVAIGKIAAYLFPTLNSFELYRVAGKPVYLPQLLIGLALAGMITAMNYRGIQISARFQKWTTFGLLALFALFGSFGVTRGSVQNFRPPFSHSGLVSILLVIQIVPYFMTGFESVPKCAEEANPEFRARGFFITILVALAAGIFFYAGAIAVVAFVHPWQPLTHQNFATAFAFRQAFGREWIVNVILAAAILSLLKIFNGNFIASSRLFMALGRRGLIDSRIGRVHERNRTPANAALLAGLLTAAGTFAGEAILIPITEVGSMASAVGWFATCAAFLAIESNPGRRLVAAVGALVAAVLLGMKLLPVVPGHFSAAEFAALAIWVAAGFVFRSRPAR
ncbi:MAG TPA: APC family permease [Terriglobia bacterium]|nr:APC family permease [Terriglobia bacterium]